MQLEEGYFGPVYRAVNQIRAYIFGFGPGSGGSVRILGQSNLPQCSKRLSTKGVRRKIPRGGWAKKKTAGGGGGANRKSKPRNCTKKPPSTLKVPCMEGKAEVSCMKSRGTPSSL